MSLIFFCLVDRWTKKKRRKKHFWGEWKPSSGQAMMKQNEISVTDRENKRKAVRCTAFDKAERIGNTRGEGREMKAKKNWQEDGGVAGRNKMWECGIYSTRTPRHRIKWEGSSLEGGAERRETLKQMLGEEPLSEPLEPEFLPPHGDMENWTGGATFYASGRLEGVQKRQR